MFSFYLYVYALAAGLSETNEYGEPVAKIKSRNQDDNNTDHDAQRNYRIHPGPLLPGAATGRIMQDLPHISLQDYA
jgi:hypothetical protein